MEPMTTEQGTLTAVELRALAALLDRLEELDGEGTDGERTQAVIEIATVRIGDTGQTVTIGRDMTYWCVLGIDDLESGADRDVPAP